MQLNATLRAAAPMIGVLCLFGCSDDDPGVLADGAPPTADAAVELEDARASADGRPADQTAPGDLGLAADQRLLGDQGPTGDQGPLGDAGACGNFSAPAGRALSVTYGAQTLDFSTGSFSSAFYDDPVLQEHYWYFIFKSADGQYGLELRMAPSGTACPETFPLPVGDRVVLIFFEAATFTEIASSAYAGAAGALTIDGYVTTDTHQELSFQCAACTLQPVPGSGFSAVVVDGGARQGN